MKTVVYDRYGSPDVLHVEDVPVPSPIGVLVVKEGPAHFEPLADLCVTGEVRIHIDRTFTLDELPAALSHVGEGRALGKVVVAPS